ncbi:hypothetical protein AP285_16665 [Limnospira platensis YZ]|nr:hypothetical protein AP285_16665 [Arthrospira platensis YZ]
MQGVFDMSQWTKLTTSIVTVILYVTVSIGFWFSSPPALAAEKSIMTEISNSWNLRSELVASISVTGFMDFLDQIPDKSQIQSMIENGIKSNSKYVTNSTRNFFKKNLPSQEQILKAINDALKQTDVAKKLVSDTTSNISSSLSVKKLADDLTQLVSHTSSYGKEMQKIATKTLPGKLGESQKLLMLVFQTITSQKLDAKSRKRARDFLETSPKMICRAYLDSKNGIDDSYWNAILDGAGTVFIVHQTITSAAVAGAGNLTGYAGIASAVSELGLGGLTTTLASTLGSSATGAAATAVVTSAVGGPMIMAALLVGGTAATTYGSSKLAIFIANKLGEWAAITCIDPNLLPLK